MCSEMQRRGWMRLMGRQTPGQAPGPPAATNYNFHIPNITNSFPHQYLICKVSSNIEVSLHLSKVSVPNKEASPSYTRYQYPKKRQVHPIQSISTQQRGKSILYKVSVPNKEASPSYTKYQYPKKRQVHPIQSISTQQRGKSILHKAAVPKSICKMVLIRANEPTNTI